MTNAQWLFLLKFMQFCMTQFFLLNKGNSLLNPSEFNKLLIDLEKEIAKCQQ